MNYYPFPQKKDCEKHTDKRLRISLAEKKKNYIAKNINHNMICVVHVDGCLIADEGKRCDYLLLQYRENDYIAYFIELKGGHILEALKQIERSIDLLLPQLEEFLRNEGQEGSFKIHGRIVGANSHALKSNQFIRLERRLKKLGGTLLYKNNIFEESI